MVGTEDTVDNIAQPLSTRSSHFSGELLLPSSSGLSYCLTFSCFPPPPTALSCLLLDFFLILLFSSLQLRKFSILFLHFE